MTLAHAGSLTAGEPGDHEAPKTENGLDENTMSAAPEAIGFEEQTTLLRERVECALEAALPGAETVPARLHAAMRYAVLGNGKRIRPLLVYGAGRVAGADPALLDSSAVAVELVHAYSLVHDDLPAMDDDDLRRGRPTCHIEFDEATAILAGDALQAQAFATLTADTALFARPAILAEIVRRLAEASGSLGMAGGQAIDLGAVGNDLDLQELEHMHACKTGALIGAAVAMGALAGGIDDEAMLERLSAFARDIGLAFQIHDDILDVEGDTAVIGKPQGSDRDAGKPTYPELVGLDGAKALAREKFSSALAQLEAVPGDTGYLAQLAEFIVRRDR